jgi:tetratricopeptide (TPR) repeat protein
MANTWDAASTLPLPPGFHEQTAEGPPPVFAYEVGTSVGRLEFSITDPNGSRLALPVEEVIGGKRHGVSFLVRISDLDGVLLARPSLLEARYAYSPHGSLVLSPGFPAEKPPSLEKAMGRVLSPAFEQRCLTCHGQPGTLGAGVHGGVRCESCHGQAASHVESMTAGGAQTIRPQTLAGPKGMPACALCHTGLSNINLADPVPGDLLVSSQIPALQHSECFRQSGGNMSCTSCHDPHRDSGNTPERAAKTCQHCHAAANPQHASICPVNASSGCIGCHMPSVPVNGFKVADHWISVHPDPSKKAAKVEVSLRSLVAPQREYLEILGTKDRAKAEAATLRLAGGDSFYDVAHENSTEGIAAAGGYVGDVRLADMDPLLAQAAARLWYGETSGIIQQGSRYVILHRLPRDFKWQANDLFLQAIRLQAAGNRKAAMAKAQAALKIYPYFLRAHLFIGTQFGEMGNAERAAGILSFAAQSFPTDAFAQFQYALSLRTQPGAQVEALRRAIELEPDIVPAYERLGAALLASGDLAGAMQVFRQGLAVDPLSATLNYDLGAMLIKQGDEAGAKRWLTLAARLDPGIAAGVKASDH